MRSRFAGRGRRSEHGEEGVNDVEPPAAFLAVGVAVEQCGHCGGRMRLIALLTAAKSIARILLI